MLLIWAAWGIKIALESVKPLKDIIFQGFSVFLGLIFYFYDAGLSKKSFLKSPYHSFCPLFCEDEYNNGNAHGRK